jgi:CTP:molybdopterin cytidylyltransferase MocA
MNTYLSIDIWNCSEAGNSGFAVANDVSQVALEKDETLVIDCDASWGGMAAAAAIAVEYVRHRKNRVILHTYFDDHPVLDAIRQDVIITKNVQSAIAIAEGRSPAAANPLAAEAEAADLRLWIQFAEEEIREQMLQASQKVANTRLSAEAKPTIVVIYVYAPPGITFVVSR